MQYMLLDPLQLGVVCVVVVIWNTNTNKYLRQSDSDRSARYPQQSNNTITTSRSSQLQSKLCICIIYIGSIHTSAPSRITT